MKLAVMEQDVKMKDEQLMRVAEELSFERDTKVCLSLAVSVCLSVCFCVVTVTVLVPQWSSG